MQYARIQNGLVAEVIDPVFAEDGTLVPLSARFHPNIVSQCVEIPEGVTAAQGYTYNGSKFSAPVVPSPVLTTAQIVASYEAALQAELDAGAQAWGYDSIISAASYAASTNPQFKAEADALIAWRDATWLWAAAQLAAVQGGTQEAPATPAAFVAVAPAQPTRPSAS